MPILAKFPSPGTYLPITCLLVLVGPALAAWIYGSLTPQLSAWGLSALSLRYGENHWLPTDTAGQAIPPLYSWLLAASLSLPLADKLPLLALPSYLYAVLCLVAIGGLCRLWYSVGTALWTCLLVAFNPLFLEQVRSGDPSLGILFWSLLGLWVYAHHLIAEEETFSRWTLLGGFSFGGLLLSTGFFAIWLPALGLLNLLLRDWERRERPTTALRISFEAPTMRAGMIVVAIGVAIASPWILTSGFSRGPFSPWSAPVVMTRFGSASLGDVVYAMPATMVLAVVGLWRSFRLVLRGTEESERATLPVVWTLVAVLAVRIMQPTHVGLLLLLVPLNLLAVRTLLEVLYRRIPDRHLLGMLLATAWFYLATKLEAFRELTTVLTSAPGPEATELSRSASWLAKLTAEQKLSMHLGFDVLLVVGVGLFVLYRLSARHDRYRRALFGSFVAAVVVLAVLPSLALVKQPLRRDDPWLRIADQLAEISDIDTVIFVGSEPPKLPLLFAVRSRFPYAATQTALGRVELETAFRSQIGRPLVLVTDSSQRLPKTTPITRADATVTLSQLYDSDEVIAYAPLTR